MHNVDTLTLSMCTEQFVYARDEDGNVIKRCDMNHTRRINQKIKDKLWLDETSRDILKNRKNTVNQKYKSVPINWHGRFEDYIVNFNETWNSLTVMLEHHKVEFADETEIQAEVIEFLKNEFGLQDDEITELKLNRIDIHCDFKYKDTEEINIIYNILDKAPDNFYTYKKEIRKNDEAGYILLYAAVRKKKYVENLIKIEG